MNDMSPVIVPKSDQISADDLLGGPRTITIAEVHISPTTEQPVTVRFEGDDGRPYKPCKSMCRVMVQAWGADANKYIGKSLTLYRDPDVKWAGMKVGGIRISHMSDITAARTFALTETRGKKTAHKVQPLTDAPKPKAGGGVDHERAALDKVKHNIGRAPTVEQLDGYLATGMPARLIADIRDARPELAAEYDAAVLKRRGELGVPAAAGDEDPFAEDNDDPFGLPPLPEKAAQDDDFIINLRESIEAAQDEDALAEVETRWNEKRGDYDEATATQIDGLFVARRTEF